MQAPAGSQATPESRRRGSGVARAFAHVAAAFGWLMCTLATGAVAALVAIVTSVRPSWWTLALAIPLTLALKYCGCLYRRWPGLVAGVAVLLAGFYAVCLVAIARIAASLGFPFGLAFRTGGASLMLQVAKLGLDAIAILVFAAAAVLAAIVATAVTRPRVRH
ncbi:MAG TPA: hypothetical protein VF292_12150 [Rhodanobacteraceae bacterium]